jgi:ABC-type nickel/cobalt efflux system permease component RcnA
MPTHLPLRDAARRNSRFIPALMFVAAFVPAVPALGHPLGNYSLNQYTLFDLRGQTPRIYYLLDIAEIPSLKEMDHLDTDYNNEFTDAELSGYLAWRVPDTVRRLELTLNGQPVTLRLLSQRVEVYEGIGMPLVNLMLEFEPDTWTWPAGPFVLDFRSYNHETAQGYREAYVLMDGRFKCFTGPWREDKELKYLTLVLEDEHRNPLFQSFYNRFHLELAPGEAVAPKNIPVTPDYSWTATARAPTDQMKLLITKREDFEGGKVILAAAADVPAPEPVASAVSETPDVEEAVAPATPDRAPPPGSTNRFNRLVDTMTGRVSDIIKNERLTPPMVLLALAIAALMGAAHAFTPGHGKTVMAAYLIGERGTAMHALVLGIVVTLTHVWSILALGLVSLYATEHISETTFTFWTAVLSGGIIVLLGLFLFRQRYAQYVLTRYGDADGAHHHHHGLMQDHTHEPGEDLTHEHGPFGAHTHMVEGMDGKPPTYRRILWLGVSGGIVPCPAALIVLLAAINIGRLPLGLLLILSFSLGLAAVLVILGIAVVRASGAVQRRLGTRSATLLLLPVFSSVLITLLGLFLVVQTLVQHKVIIIPG